MSVAFTKSSYMKSLISQHIFGMAARIFFAGFILIGAAHSLRAQSNETHLKFVFGQPTAPAGWTAVQTNTIYSKETGFGFEPGADLQTPAHVSTNKLEGSVVTSDKPFFFHAAVPEGNYKVTVTLGGATADSETTVNAELRRLMVQQLPIESNHFVTREFIVNVRQPAISSGGEVRLTPREKTNEWWAWDDRLTLEFLGKHPSVAVIEIEKVEVPTVFLLGDSTVCDQPREPYNSWGQMITRFFKPQVAIANHSESGESTAGALAKNRFKKIWADMKPGDYLIVQFGHNDMKSTATNALETYTDNLRRAVEETRKRGGIPVLCTSVSRRTFDTHGKVTNSFRGYTDAVRQVAKEKDVPLIDLQQMGAAFYEALGPEDSHKAFATQKENTHHNDYGSYEIAKCVLDGIRQNHLDLAKYIVDDFNGFDPSHPDAVESFGLPASSLITQQTPAGN
jgi:lysophospholipase L1-like esterase